MKKLIPFLTMTFFGLVILSCSTDDDTVYVDYDTYPIVYDLRNVNFENVGGSYQISRSFNSPMYETDMLLMYMQVGTTNNNSPIWQQIPITFYLNDGHEVDYNYDFSRYDFVIYAGGTFDLYNTNYVINQSFRVLLVPASYGRSTEVDYSDYNSVVQYYNIDDSQPTIL